MRRFACLTVLVLASCLRPAPAPPDGAGGVAFTVTPPPADDHDDDAAGEDPRPIEDRPIGFGYGPDDVAIIEWTPSPGESQGPARLRLPNGEELSGTWRAQDNAVPSAGTSVESTDPRGDPGDPTSMPAGHPRARQIVIELTGDRGTELRCTIPDASTNKKKRVGACHDDERRFSARMR